MGPWRLRLVIVGWACALTAMTAGPAASQKIAIRAGEDGGVKPESAAGQSVFVPADRAVLLRLSDARQLLEQSRYAEAVRLLGSILENQEDYFFQPEPTSAVHRSIKAEARQLLGSMPRQGRELYELQYGARARQMLGEAVKSGSAAGLAEVARRFFHTQAGNEATFLLGLHHLDHGAPLAGALTLQQIEESAADSARFEPTLSVALATCWMRAGMPEKAQAVLETLRKRHPGMEVEVAGKKERLPADGAKTLDWLAALVGKRQAGSPEKAEQWAMYRGNAARNAASTGSGPLMSMRWEVSTYEEPYVETLIDQIDQLHRQSEPGRESLPGLYPLVVNDVVLMRTVRNLLAVDFVTGKRIWEVPADDPLKDADRPTTDPATGAQRQGWNPFGQRAQDLEVHIGLQLRLWEDATYGTLSSDGQLVFAVEDLDLAPGNVARRQMVVGMGAEAQPSLKSYNRLAAYDIRSGKLKWHIGGSPTEFGLQEAGMFFLGPPLPLMGELYVLGEVKGEIRLLALEARDGSVLWTQQLAVVDRDIRNDPMRRLAGASPSYADGILVCPTANHSVVAMDLATRSLLWGYTYQEEGRVDQRQLMVFGIRSLMSPDPMGRWNDATATIADGRVLITPPDSNRIYCLSLVDGRALWSQSRQNDLYLACVYQGKVVLAGRDRMRALRLEDGEAAWDARTVAFPEGSSPSGRGFESGGRYYVPLSSAEVVAVALDTGKIEDRFKSRDGMIAGNLVCYKDNIISQRADAVDAFYQVDALMSEVDRRLKSNPKDAEALALRGQVYWEEGKLDQAIESLRSAWELKHEASTRELLRDALLEGLRTDFAKYREQKDEIVGLIDVPAQRAAYLRLMAEGCRAAKEYDAALDFTLQLVSLDRQHRDVEVIDKSLVVRRDRWLRMRLADLHEEAPEAVRAALDETAKKRLDEAVGADSSDALRQYLDYFGSLPTAAQARRRLLDRLKREGRLMEAELLLAGERHSGDKEAAAAALAEQAELLRGAGRIGDAARCYERLESEYADVVCEGGKTGRELAASLPADGAVARALKPASVWLVGKVAVGVDNQSVRTPQAIQARAVVEYSGSPGPFFSDIDIEVRQASGALLASDGLGQPLWEVSGREVTDQVNFVVSAAFMRVAVKEHLLLLTVGQKIVAIDTLAGSEGPSARIAWSRDVDEETGELAMPMAMRRQAVVGGRGFQRLQTAQPPDASPGVPMAISDRAFCYQRFRDLVAIDPASGEMLWTRHGVEPGSTIFGDREHILIAAPGANKATVVRTVDGSLVGTRMLPAQRTATLGRLVLVVSDRPEGRMLQMVDPLDSREAWPAKHFTHQTRLCLVDNETVGALEPTGHFMLIRLEDGRTLVDAEIKGDVSAEEIHVLRSSDGTMLIGSSSRQENSPTLRSYPLQAPFSVRIAQGWVCGFSRTGALLWPEPVVIRNQHLPLNQPRRLPVLVFACMTQQSRPKPPLQTKTSLLFLDKRTGRRYAKELAYATNNFQLTAAPDEKNVQMQLQRNRVTLTFTDEPLGPEEPEPVAESEKPSTARALLNAWGNAALKAFGGPLNSGLPPGVAREAEKAVENAIRPAQRPEKAMPKQPEKEKPTRPEEKH